MTRPGFRRSSAGGGSAEDRDRGAPRAGAPFSQAQILHLMKSEFSRARRHGHPIACLLLRVDRPLGREEDLRLAAARDAVRSELGRLVAEKTRDHDYLGFLEDDGYLLVLPHADTAAGKVVANRIREGMARLEVSVGDQPLRSTLSVGVAATDGGDTMFFDTLLSQAELALEWAIDAGGDRAETFRRDRFITPPPDDDQDPPTPRR